MDWKAIEEKIVQDDQNKWDRKANGQQLKVNKEGVLELPDNGDSGNYQLSDLALTQMCQRLDVPVAYYRRLPGEMKAMVANYDLSRQNGQGFLLRGKGGWIRAFLSDRYVVYNNTQISEVVQELLKEANVEIKTFVFEETHMFLKIVSEEIVDPASGLKAGVMVGNSEVGLGSISVEPFVFRKVCTNDLIVAQEKSFRHAHIHFTPSELNRRMAEGISHALEVASSTLDTFLAIRMEPIIDPVAAIRKIAEERKLSQRFTDEVVSHYQVEPDPSRFGVINAFTSAAQTLAPLQRIGVERVAGAMVEGRV